MTTGHFLGGVAGLIWDPASGRYLLLRRAAERDFQAGTWECVTGRVEQGESFEQALHREIMEETGLQVEIEFMVATTHFFRGEPVQENELLGLIFSCLLGEQKDIRINPEHSEYRWASAKEIDAMFPDGHWLKKSIQRAELQRKLLPQELQKIYREKGFAV